ncbi:MAG: hypothetical protein F7C35_08145 [Desulfurococcales archaeon]|nr:hypothetical protein [Desulfurococcales archaeon]
MKSELLLFTVVAILVVLLSLLSSPPIEIKASVGSQYYTYVMGPYDNSSLGHSTVYSLVESMGYNITTDPTDSYDGVLILYTPRTDYEAASQIVSLTLKSRKHYVILAGHGALISAVEYGLGIPIARAPYIPAGTYLVVDNKGVSWFDVLNMSEKLPRPGGGGYEVLAYTYPGYEPIAIAMTSRDGVRLVAFLEGYDKRGGVFSNYALHEALKLNMTPTRFLQTLLDAAGAEKGDTLLVPGDGIAFKRVPVRGAEPVTLARIDVRHEAADFVERLLGWEKGVTRYAGPGTLLALALFSPLIAYASIKSAQKALASRRGSDEPLESHEAQPVLGFSHLYLEVRDIVEEGGKLTKEKAKQLIRSLYLVTSDLLERELGLSIEQVLARRDELESLSTISGIPVDRLEWLLRRLLLVYRRKVEAGKVFPLVNLRKEALRLYEGLTPLVEALGFKVVGRRGAEYV